MKLFDSKYESSLSVGVVLSIVFGFAAGMVGQIVSDVYLDPYGSEIFSNVNTNGNINSDEVIPELRRVKRFLGIEQDFEVNEAVQKINPTVAGVYRKKTSSGLNGVYFPSEVEANAVVLTSDGWLVSFGKVFDGAREGLVVVHNNSVYEIEEIIIDSASGATFVKISAHNLPVVALGDSEELVSGQISVVLNSLAHVSVANLQSVNYVSYSGTESLIRSTENYRTNLLLEGATIDQTYTGAPVANLAGEVVGMITSFDIEQNIATAVPINQFRNVVLDVLRSRQVIRPSAGIIYIDLLSVPGIDPKLVASQNRGALVYKTPEQDSAAFQSGLKKDDILLSVDGELIDHDSSLTELIQQYKPGNTVKVEVLREGKILEISITLGKIK